MRFDRLSLTMLALAACVRTPAAAGDAGGAGDAETSDSGAGDARAATPPITTPPITTAVVDAAVDAGTEALTRTARGYLDAWRRGDADALFEASTPAMRSMVWKSSESLARLRSDEVKRCGAEKSAIVDALFVLDAGRAYLRHFAVHERARCETTVYLERGGGRITGWLSWELPLTAPVVRAPAAAREAARTYVKAFDDGAVELVWNASSERMQHEVWQSLGNLGGWRRTAMKTMAGAPTVQEEHVSDEHGLDRYEAVRAFGGRRFRTEITMDRPSHRILGWKTEPI